MSINVNDKNLGHATAYAYYKAGGGTMTEAEFTEFMADFGTASQTAVEAAQAALASKNAAQTAATTATNKASEATTAATTATTAAEAAQADADAAALDASQALSAASTATTKATEATTAAATAVSAKDDAVSANTAAQSAKTAAQTAQTGAETAAASVSASAEQIATNASDISQLKSDLSPLDLIGITCKYTASSGYQNIPVSIEARTYICNCTDVGATITFLDADNSKIAGISIPANASNSLLTVSDATAEKIAYLRMYQGVVTIKPSTNIVTRVSEIESVISNVNPYADYDLKQDRKSRYNLDQKNPFAWKAFDKAYFSFMNDDGRSDMYLYKNLCDTYNIPYANAVPWEAVENNTTVVDGLSLIDYCKKIVADGGEIFTHAYDPLTSASSEEDILQYFRNGKKIIEDAIGSNVRGIIQAGGSGYSTFDYNEGQKFCLAYYDFSDGYGTTPQYTLYRTRILRSNYASDTEQINAFKAVIDDAIANNTWVRFYCHGTDEISISVLTSVFDYIATKLNNGDCAWTTWEHMYDTFRSSRLENRISELEAK